VIRVVNEHNIMSKKFLKGVLGIEIIIVLGTYRTWHYMNTDQTYRKWMHDNYPTLLKGFYNTASIAGYSEVKQEDYKAWNLTQE